MLVESTVLPSGQTVDVIECDDLPPLAGVVLLHGSGTSERLSHCATLPLLALAILAVALIPIVPAATAQVDGQTLTFAITSGGDDVESEPDGSFNVTSGDIDVHGSATAGLLYRQVCVDDPNEIESATLTMTAHEPDNTPTVARVRAEATARPEPFSVASPPASRPLTSAEVSWTMPAWQVGHQATSPDISDLLREVVGRADWQACNDIAIIITGSPGSDREAVSFETNPATAPQLTISTVPVPSVDVVGPSRPGFDGYSVTADSATLGWTASTDNVGVDHYRVRLEGTGFDSEVASSERRWTFDGVPPGGYVWDLSAVDAAGNASESRRMFVNIMTAAESAASLATTDEIVAAFEAFAADRETYKVGGSTTGAGWFNYANGTSYPTSMAVVLVEGGYLPASYLNTRYWDFMVYHCGSGDDRRAIIASAAFEVPAQDDIDAWRGCTRSVIDRYGHTYYRVTRPIGEVLATVPPDGADELDPRIPPLIDLCAADAPERSILRVGPGEEYTTLQAAADQADPGDSICMRGGIYTNAENAPFANLDRDGTAQSPIFVGPLPGEVVVLQGTGTEAAWDDATFQEWEDGDRNMAFIINGDHWIVSGFEIRYLNRGIRINGDYNTVIGVHGHNFWESGFDMGRDPADATIGPDLDVVGNRYALIHSEFCRHCSGTTFGPQGNEATLLQDNTFEFISGGSHGYEPDGDKVPPVAGDPAGGGNSDMLSGGKECSDGVQDGDFTMANGETDNICRNTTIRYVIGWHNADDSFDVTPNGVTFMANIGFNPGPEGNKGLKNLRPSFGSQDYFANLMVGGEAGDTRGFEARFAEPMTRWINNAAYANDNQGYIFSFADGVSPGAQVVFENNVSAGNGQAFANVAGGAEVGASNIAADIPMLSGGDPAGFSLDAESPRTMAPRERWNNYYQQFASYFRPAAGSPLVDAGVFVAGVHCDRADDDPANPYPESDLECVHWRGTAPDQGPFESVD